MNPTYFELSNGIKVVHLEEKNTQTVHCAFLINAGSRDEQQDEHGVAHLIEHCLFKGTKKRKAYHIMTRLDSVGGEINAYTSKEETCVYTASASEHFERAAELMADVVFHSTFPQHELEKEISVVCDEIAGYKDNPDEMLAEEFDERFFPNQSMGRSILGTKKSVRSMTPKDLQRFTQRTYTTDRIVFAVVGNISARTVARFVKKHLDPIATHKSDPLLRDLPRATHFEVIKKARVHQVHVAMGAPCPSLLSDKRVTMVLLNNILGGPALNSRLNLRIRERYGFCYFVESSYNALSNWGTFHVYFGTDRLNFEKTLRAVRHELAELCNIPISSRSLEQFKVQLIGQILLAQENPHAMMTSLARSALHFHRLETFEELRDAIQSISSSSLQQLAADVFLPERLSLLAFTNES